MKSEKPISQKAMKTKEGLLQSALALFRKSPVHKVSVAKIVERAGVAKGTFYTHFHSKDDLVWHLIDNQFREIHHALEALSQKGHSEADISHFIDLVVDLMMARASIIRMMHHEHFSRFLGFEHTKRIYMEKWRGFARDWIHRGQATGHVHVQNSEFTAFLVVTALHESLEAVILGTLSLTPEALKDALKQTVMALLNM